MYVCMYALHTTTTFFDISVFTDCTASTMKANVLLISQSKQVETIDAV